MRQLIICLMGVVLFSFFLSCQKEISVEYGEPAKGSLQSSAGDCLPKLVAGSYVANKTLNDSNFIEVTVNVTTAGPYNILTDTINGYSFKASGTFAATGTTTVRLKGSGMPMGPGVNDFLVTFDGSTCYVDVTVLPSGATGGAAAFTLNGSPGGCALFGLTGNYYKDTTLDARHKVSLNVNVTTVGTYTVTTNTQNGYFFSTTGTFGSTGPQAIVLNGSGKPLAVGTNDFTVTAGGATCTFSVTVTAPATPGNCTPPTLQGTYTAGTATTTANKVTFTHNYTTAGTYNVTTTPVNGYSFGAANFVATAGTNTVVLSATGTPLAAGTNTFTVNFGDGQTCTFTITVGSGTTPPPNTDYFPIAANNWWSYDYTGGSPDTLIMKVTGPATIGGQAYQRFEWSSNAAGGPFAEYFYRKDASNGFYYEGMDTTGFGPQVTFTQSSLHVNFLRNTLTTGQTWNTDIPVTLSLSTYSGPATLRFKYTCVNNNATVTTATGRTLNNVYEVHFMLQVGIAGQFQDAGDLVKTYYARGIGQVKYLDDSDPTDIYQELIRYWQVN